MRLRALLVAIAFCGASLAHADVFNFNAEGGAGGFNGSGTLTANANGDGSFTVVDITGPGVTGLIGPGQFELNDNQLFPGQEGLVDVNGLAFTDVLGSTSYDINVFYDAAVPGYFSILQDSDGNTQLLNTTFNVSAVTPEPSSIALLGTGLLLVAGVVRRRFVL